MDVVGQWTGVVDSASEDVNRQQASVRIAVCADMALVNQHNSREAGRAVCAIELRDMGVDLSDARSPDAVTQHLQHPLTIVVGR